MKIFKNRKNVAGVLFLTLVILLPLMMNVTSETSNAFEIYSIYEDNPNLQATGVGFGALFAAGAAVGIICGVQLAVGILAVA